jgi:Protein of unknown function (DUF3074)
MTALHSALQALGPCKFEDIPPSRPRLESYLQELFGQSQLILESVPIPPPDGKGESRPRSNITSCIASNASEISSSTARSAPPLPEHAALQKEWGKPVKLSAKDNPLNMAVYRLGGKDGRGAWFARRSVHEGLGFAKFKKSLEMEFPESLAVQGAPGEGNIRGIGGDKKVADTSVPGKGRMEVFQLSAQFPGPTAARDFVTLLLTSSNAMKRHDEAGRPDLSPRHYMIISKPCDHPDTQPRDGYVRGNYESVEFIREVPGLPKKTRSSVDLSRLGVERGSGLEKEAVLRSAEKKQQNHTVPRNHETKTTDDLGAAAGAGEEANRRRGKTISFSESRAEAVRAEDDEDDAGYDPESNPVEWIMVTRSDPGGSVPRFLVERGTPGSIVADASKFLDWACQQENVQDDSKLELGHHLASLASYEANGHLAGLDSDSSKEVASSGDRLSAAPSAGQFQENSANRSGVLANMTGAFSAGVEGYVPQMILDRLPGHASQASEDGTTRTSTPLNAEGDGDGDLNSLDSLSTTSFASAGSHLDSEADDLLNLSPSTSKLSSPQKDGMRTKDKAKDNGRQIHITQHEKELAKLDARRSVLDAKLASTLAKSTKSHESQTLKEREALRKAEEKHAQEISKQEEKYRKEIEKLGARRKREEQKMEERRRKKSEKEARRGLEKERDESREEVARLQAEREVWKKQIGDLQRENTGLVVRIGKLEKMLREDRAEGGKEKDQESEKATGKGVVDKDGGRNSLLKEGKGGGRVRDVSFGSGSPSASSVDSARSRSSSLLKRGTLLRLGSEIRSEKAGGGGSGGRNGSGSGNNEGLEH